MGYFTIIFVCCCSPFPLRLGNGFYNNPYALQIHDLTRFRMLVHERIWEKRKKNEPCNGPRSWDDIKRGFDTICHNHNGKSVSEGSPVRKRCKDTVIDLTGDTVTHVSTRERSYFEADGANLPGKLTQATVSDPTYSFRLVKPHVMQIPNGPKRIIQRMGIFNVPREFFLDHQHGLRRLNMVRIKNVRKVMLIMPHSDIGLASMFNDFLKEFSEYMASEYIPKAFKNIDNLIKTIPENILCYCGLSDGSHKHLALPAYRLECNHLVCGACLREAVRQGKHITDVYAPCCNMKMRAMPYRISSLDDYMNMQLEAQNLKKEYDAAYRIPSHIASKLEKELHNVSQQKQGDVSYREMASHGNLSDLTEGKTCNLLPKPTFIVCKTAMTSSCEACNKTLSDEENNLVFGIQQDRASHWYHIKCVDPGIRFRALTEGIHGFGTMDSITKKQVIQCIMNNDITT